MLALMTNFMAFYLAAALFERTGILCAVTVFLVTALAGTFIASVIEESLPPFSLQRIQRGRRQRGGTSRGSDAIAMTPAGDSQCIGEHHELSPNNASLSYIPPAGAKP